MGNQTFDTCQIMRTQLVHHGKFNLITGETTITHTETVTKACGIPLFHEEERRCGICRSCRQGWEADGNMFASDEERARATGTEVAECADEAKKRTADLL